MPSAIIVFLLCVLPSRTALELSDQDCTLNRLPSLYEQYCCVEDNHGKTFMPSDNEDKVQYIICPQSGKPNSCSKVNVFPSCSAIHTYIPTATSGYYNIMLANGTVITDQYCDMEGVNCDGEGGWMRVAYLNMSDPSEQCPSGFRLYEENGIRACGRNDSDCQSVEFPSYPISYSQVCGRVTGYQKGRPNGIAGVRTPDIDIAFLDGVSLTRGSSPRKHVWTFIAARFETDTTEQGCPCATNSTNNRTMDRLTFIAEDYFCEAGSQSLPSFHDLFTDDPLWDGQGCRQIAETPCCNVTGIPWFNKVLEQPTTDYIELRVCANGVPSIEDSPVGHYEIYVK